MSDTTTTIGATIIGGAIAILASIVAVIYGDSRKRKETKIAAWNDLIAELKQNVLHQGVSGYISLEDAAFKRFRKEGLLNDLDEGMRAVLSLLYSRIHEKNELIATWRSAGIQIGSRFVITNAENKNPTNFEVVLSGVTNTIRDMINDVLPRLEKMQHVPPVTPKRQEDALVSAIVLSVPLTGVGMALSSFWVTSFFLVIGWFIASCAARLCVSEENSVQAYIIYFFGILVGSGFSYFTAEQALYWLKAISVGFANPAVAVYFSGSMLMCGCVYLSLRLERR